ncbi:MAG: HAMP domain-containing protein [Ectothiorhodospiraceae bacterium]|nr:HAMP domain-containing protein [Chromatiales bacterium]MCP5154762.1 HAMP domain-containing protein [Ectothiorhodospiraceae bacterium]
MMSQIALLQSIYHFERLVAGEGAAEARAGITAAVAELRDELQGVIEHPTFRSAQVPAELGNGSFSSTFETALTEFESRLTAAISAFDAFGAAKVSYEAAADGLLGRIGEIEEKADGTVEARSAGIAAMVLRADAILAVTVLVSVIVAVLAAVWIVRAISRPLDNAVGVANRIAEGDLTARIDASRTDELGAMLKALAEMQGRLGSVIGEIKEASERVASGAQEIAEGNDSLSRRTEAQAASLEETASSMEEMTSTVRQTADNARQANQLAASAREQAEKGGNVVDQTVTAMREISASSGRIADIIGVIDDIAFQTNLLALNAAVEAARAGEQGRGFAVVAGEVRNLAQRSAEAAKEIKSLISDSVSKVDDGVRLVDESGRTLGEIVVAVKKVSDIIAEIAAASSEQSSGIDQVNTAVGQMDEMTQSNAALVEQAASASAAMGTQARTMAELVSFFRLAGDGARAPAPVREAAPVRDEADEYETRAEADDSDGDELESSESVSGPPAGVPERRAASRPWTPPARPAASSAPASAPASSGGGRRAAAGGGDDEHWEEF